jgi:hypothetical protein
MPGDILKNQVLGLPEGPEWGYGLDISRDGNITVCGVAYPDPSVDLGELGNGDAWIIRLDQNGTILWEKLFGGNETDYALSVRNLPDGGAAVIGTTGSYNGDVTNYHGNGDMWFLNIGQDGNFAGNKHLGGAVLMRAQTLHYCQTGAISSVAIPCPQMGMSDDNSVTGTSGSSALTETAHTMGKTYGGSRRDSGTSITLTRDNAIVACGNTNSTDNMVSGNRTSSDVG